MEGGRMSNAGRRILVGVIAVATAALAIPSVGASPRSTVAGSQAVWARPANLVRPVAPGEPVTLNVYLGWRDDASLQALVASVTNPRSPRYGRYLTAAQFQARFSPSAAHVAAVQSWLRSRGLAL